MPHEQDRALDVLAVIAMLPSLAFLIANLAGGSLAALCIQLKEVSRQAARLAVRILNGESPSSIQPVLLGAATPVYDWRELTRWHISGNRLPPGSVVHYRQPTLWEEYRWYIIGSLVLLLVQAVFIAGLVVSRMRRRRAEVKLQETQEFMDLATSAGALGLWARDLQNGNFSANATLRHLYGFSQNGSLDANDLLARIHPDDRERVVSAMQSAHDANLPFEGEFRVLSPEGTERWLLAKGRTVNHPRHRRVRMGVVLDITERKKMEEDLRESEERFRTMANAAPVMIWMSNADKRCTFFNKGWLDFTGRTLENELGEGWTEGVHREDIKRCRDVYGSAFDARREFTMEYRLRRSGGEYCWVLDHGVPRFETDGTFLGYIGTAVDISEGKRSQERLKNERAFLRQVIDIDPNFIFAKDRDGRFTLVNRAVADAYGTTVEELIGRTDVDFNPNRAEAEHFQRIDLEVIDTLQERFIPEECLTDARGQVRWLQTVKRPIVESDGVANQVLGASTDITRRKEAEAELRQQRDELAHLMRVSTMGELATSLAHELNQPLTAILSNAQAAQRFLAANPADVNEVTEILRDIVEDDNRASQIIQRMRVMVKKDEPKFSALDLAVLISDVVLLVRSDAVLHNVSVSVQLDAGLPPVRGDRVQLQQVVINLLLNAFDAMKDCPPSERAVLVKAELDGAERMKISIADRGIGLSSDRIDRIFQPFYTTKREGLGMGLSISRSIIEAHGGKLWAENKPERGATFCFTLPIWLASDNGLSSGREL